MSSTLGDSLIPSAVEDARVELAEELREIAEAKLTGAQDRIAELEALVARLRGERDSAYFRVEALRVLVPEGQNAVMWATVERLANRLRSAEGA